MNRALAEKRATYEKEKNDIIKDYKSEVKAWKKELGQLNRKHINLQKKFKQLRSDDQQILPFTLSDSEPKLERIACPPTEPINCCSICSLEIACYVPEYFMGETVNPACDRCKREAELFIENDSLDPFSSFPDLGVPFSLVTHWIPPLSTTSPNLLSIPSLRAHYVRLPNPGSRFLSTAEVFQEFKALMDEQRNELKDGCRQN